jgi:hypothetical protein
MIFLGGLIAPIMSIAYSAAQDSVRRAFKKSLEAEAKRQAFESQLPALKALIAEQVAAAYTEQVKERSEGYIKAISQIELEVEIPEDVGEDFVIIAKNVLRRLEVFVSESNSDQGSPIISYLKKRYKEEDIKIITGRLYGAHYVKQQSEGVFSIYNRMAYAPLVDANKPWLSSEETASGIGELIAEKATQFFQEEFDVSLGGDEGQVLSI